MYQSKSLTLLLLLVALCAGALSLQSSGGRWKDIPKDFRVEAHDDSIAIREDATLIRDGAKSAPIELKVMCSSLRYHVTALHAAARAETKAAAIQFSHRLTE